MMDNVKKCAFCGNILPAQRGNNRKYCSPKCARDAETEKNMKAISAKSNHLSKIKHDIYSVFEHKCALCGWKISNTLLKCNNKYQYAYGNEIHHIIPIKDGGTDEFDNLILLCPNHHKLADLGLIQCSELQKYTKSSIDLEEYQKEIALNNQCSNAIAALIFSTSQKGS